MSDLTEEEVKVRHIGRSTIQEVVQVIKPSGMGKSTDVPYVLRRRASLAIDAHACRRLWRAVLIECLRKWFRPKLSRQYDAGLMPEGWLDSAGFREVCDLADIDPGSVRAWALEEVRSGRRGEVLTRRG